MAPRIFLLEDDLNIAQGIRAVMDREGWEFRTTDKASQAVPLIEKFNPDIILLDVQLPDGSGFEVCSRLAADDKLSSTPVIFITAKGDVESRLKGFAVGGRDYVGKPFAVDELAARIRAHLSAKKRTDFLARKVHELSMAERVRQDVMDMIIHDLRAPLGTIEATLEILHDSGLIAESAYNRLLKNAREASGFALCMVSDLLDVGAGRIKIEAGALNVHVLTNRLKSLFASQLERQKVLLDMDIVASGPSIQTDPSLLFRVLMNLMSNAIKFSKSGDKMELKIRTANGKLRAEMADKGPGVPDPEKENIFRKYHRAQSPGYGAVPGSGIGLAFCKLACDALGGKIWVEDNPGGGSRFIVELPSL